MQTPSRSKLSLIAISLLCLAVVPIGVSAAEKKVIVKEPEKHKEVVVKEKKEVVVVRPVRPWAKKPHYGQIVAGVTLGTTRRSLYRCRRNPRPPSPARGHRRRLDLSL
jgi:hypothetical protein